jgi:hypothetical protein
VSGTQPRNPALELYDFWRAFIRFHCESGVDDIRTDKYASTQSVQLDRYVKLSVAELSDLHLPQERLPFEADTDNALLEPVITLTYRHNSGQVFTLYPNGDFVFNSAPNYYYRELNRYTFLYWSWAMRKRAFVVQDEPRRAWGPAGAWVNPKDFERGRPYLTFDRYKCPIHTDVDYRLVKKDAHSNDWVLQVVGNRESDAARAVKDSYAFAAARYDRFQRSDERAQRTPCRVEDKTNEKYDELVRHVASLVTVYEPRPKEATQNGSNVMVDSTVAQ